ncbi:MAG TPA: NAD(P)(+) transhydrogenase (Re/Si-specific) subunit beta [Thermomicrobiales bacterium]|nr:NAD(P)(+) transhydrogenase (Re/Si-specific) subunit beta [Thermomicrobiales bacterium]
MVDNWRDAFIDVSYFISAVLLIIALNRLGSPRTARLGNQLAAGGMALAILATFFHRDLTSGYWIILFGMVIGGSAGYVMAQRVQMTAMPQMIAIFNGMGGATSALVAVSEFLGRDELGRGTVLSIALGCIIGSIALTGSLVAFGKLQGLVPSRTTLPGNRQLITGGLLGGMVLLGAMTVFLQVGAAAQTFLVLTFLLALVAGVLLVMPIGGADMPVVIAMLNALTGVAAVLTGFVMDNQLMVVAGTLVGASGMFLSLLMARAMNRSVAKVLFGAFGAASGATGSGTATVEDRPIREVTPEDAAVSLAYADRVIVVPGYGLAVAQAQHAVQELASVLQERGVDVRYAIHPVAGRMPGHMNVLLAEANVPYDDLYEMERINEDFTKTDVVLVIGANDVTNPAARDDPNSPIYGMPVLRVDEAERVIVLKRGMSPGFAGVENALFHNPKTSMLFGDAKDSLGKLTTEVRAA